MTNNTEKKLEYMKELIHHGNAYTTILKTISELENELSKVYKLKTELEAEYPDIIKYLIQKTNEKFDKK